ncbi:MAG: hypothetical protein QOG70_3398 [Solirubrobacteraceae bacterium]|jgi:nucleotide-binding universal stress UspA family protein|nr:hypothetical protein [Solirubrobacteraceae bacterium]
MSIAIQPYESSSMFGAIVVGVDGHAGGRDALALAKRLGDLGGGELVAVHVYPCAAFPMSGRHEHVDARLRNEAHALIRCEIAEVGAAGARSRVTADNSPARGLHRVAEQLAADLIVVGCAHRGAVGRLVAGDTACSVLQGSLAPVIVTPRLELPSLRERPVIGLGYDGSGASRTALAWAGRLADAVRGTVRVLTVAQSPGLVVCAGSYGIDWDALAPERRAHAVQLAADAVDELGDRATGRAIDGTAHERLRAFSEEVDVLVLGSRGYGPVRRTLLGSTSDRLVHGAACPVVLIPRAADVASESEGTAVEQRA